MDFSLFETVRNCFVPTTVDEYNSWVGIVNVAHCVAVEKDEGKYQPENLSTVFLRPIISALPPIGHAWH